MRMSVPIDRHMPPPMAGPLTAPITGWGSLRIWGTMSPKYSMARMARRDSVRPSA